MQLKCFTFNMFGVNTYIVWDDETKEAAIVDPGMISDKDNLLVCNFIEGHQLAVKHLINTHFHIDHTFGIDYIKEKYNLPITGHQEEQMWATQRLAQAQMFNLPIEHLPPLKIENFVEEGNTIYLGKEPLEIIHVPGHSPGSIVLYAPKSNFVLSGDVLFRFSIGRTDLPQGDYRQLINGIKHRLLTLPPDTAVYPGHGEETTIADEAAFNPYIQ